MKAFTQPRAHPSEPLLTSRPRKECADCRKKRCSPRQERAVPVAQGRGIAVHPPPYRFALHDVLPGRGTAPLGKREAAFNDREPEDEHAKVEVAGWASSVGRTIGAVGGRIARAAASLFIAWPQASYTSDATNGSSTTVEEPFNVRYGAEKDVAGTSWQMRVRSISGGARIHVRTGGSRNPFSRPPTSEAEAQGAVTDMKGYYARGSRGSWHTEAASKAHEQYHYREWQCSSNHYWPTARTAIHVLTAPVASHASEASAVTAMQPGADAIMTSFRTAARSYWFSLADNASSRPYAAGQQMLNGAVAYVQLLSALKGWTVDQGLDWPSDANPCYQPYPAYTP